MAIRTLIVDDESLARERIRTLLRNESDFHIVGEAEHGLKALEKILTGDVDLVFLDIQMPELDGIRLLEKIPVNRLPLIVFTTAYDSFAVTAFDLNAIDYILKPFTKKRFQQTLSKVKDNFRSADKDLISATMMSTLQSIMEKKKYPDRVVVKSEGKIRFIPVAGIVWAESDANYVHLHTGAEKIAMRETMSHLTERLDPSVFIRTHRSILVQLSHIKELKPWFNDELVVILNDGTQLPVGRTFRKKLLTSIRNL